jgi:hypothetical protein
MGNQLRETSKNVSLLLATSESTRNLSVARALAISSRMRAVQQIGFLGLARKMVL